MIEFPVIDRPDGKFQVMVKTIVGLNVIGPRLIKTNPQLAPELEDTFDVKADAIRRAQEWILYTTPAKKKKRGRK